MSDSHYCTFFNQPPQLSVSEMVGDLPCAEELWDAKSAAHFEHLSAVNQLRAASPPSVRYLVNTLMHGPWTPAAEPCRSASHFDLYIAMAGTPSPAHKRNRGKGKKKKKLTPLPQPQPSSPSPTPPAPAASARRPSRPSSAPPTGGSSSGGPGRRRRRTAATLCTSTRSCGTPARRAGWCARWSRSRSRATRAAGTCRARRPTTSRTCTSSSGSTGISELLGGRMRTDCGGKRLAGRWCWFRLPGVDGRGGLAGGRNMFGPCFG